MRALVLALALLAGLKVWYQDSVFRDAAEAAVSAAYRAPATLACQKLRQAARVDWSTIESLHLVAGNRDIPVQFWQVDHALWNARFKNPYLVIKAAGDEGRVVCTYDIASGQAALTRS
jgi:hypothetical protein